jgi:plasmid stability protein
MTMTVKLDASLERSLRKKSAEKGLSASALIREALRTYLAQTEPPQPSAFALGEDLFGRYGATPTLASERKTELAKVWAEKRPQSLKPRPAARRGKG